MAEETNSTTTAQPHTCPQCGSAITDDARANGRVYTVHGSEKEYCSSECTQAVTEKAQPTKKRRRMKVTSSESPGTGAVVQHVCDNCGKVLHLTQRGRNGEYCSKKCQDAKEGAKVDNKESATMAEKENNMATAAAAITAPKSKKAKAKKSTTKPAVNSKADQRYKVLAKDNTCRKDTMAFHQMQAVLKSTSINEAQKRFDASGHNPKKGYRYIPLASLVAKKIIKLV